MTRRVIYPSPPAVRRLSPKESAELIFNLLHETGDEWTRKQVEEETGLTTVQFRRGWHYLKRTLDGMAVVRPARENSVYFLAGEGDQDLVRRQQMWQGQYILSRLSTLLVDVKNMHEFDTKHGGLGKDSLYNARKGVESAQLGMTTLIRSAGINLNMPEAQIEKIVENALH